MVDLIRHKRANFDYELLDTSEAGISLLGTEVKSLRKGQGKIDGAYVAIRGGEAYLFGAHIPPYQSANTDPSYDPDRVRKLLLSKKELAQLERAGETKGLTILPIKLYTAGRHIKLKLAVARGKKKYDKRETIKERESKRATERLLKNQ